MGTCRSAGIKLSAGALSRNGAARGHATMVGRHASPRPRGAGRGRGTVHRRPRGTASLSGGRGAAVVRGAQEGTGQPAAHPGAGTSWSGSAATRSISTESSNGRWPCCCASRTCDRERSRVDPFRKTNGSGLMHALGGCGARGSRTAAVARSRNLPIGFQFH